MQQLQQQHKREICVNKNSNNKTLEKKKCHLYQISYLYVELLVHPVSELQQEEGEVVHE